MTGPNSGNGRKPDTDIVVAMGGKERLVELCDLPLDLYQHCRQRRQGSANSLRAVSFIFQNGDQLPDIASALWCHNAKLGKVTT